MIIMGVDPGLATIGYGIIESGRKNKMIDFGVISTPPKISLPIRLKQIFCDIGLLIKKYDPDAIAVEELFFNTNVTTAIAVAQARGAIMVAASNHTDKIYEYTPLQIKQAIVGYGRAEKIQIQKMVQTLLSLEKIPKPDDAADALAVALCHANTKNLSELFRV